MLWFNDRKQEIFKFSFTVRTKASDISFYIKKTRIILKIKKKKTRERDTKEYLQSSLKQISIYPLVKSQVNKVL